MADVVRLLQEGENYTVGNLDDVILAEGKNQKVIIPKNGEFVHVILLGENCEVICHGENCSISTLSGRDHKIEIAGRFNTVVCNGCCLVSVTGNGNNIVVVGPWPVIHCSGYGCTVSGALDAAEVVFTEAEDCTAVSRDSIEYLAPGEGTKAIVDQHFYAEGEDLTKGKFYRVINGGLNEVQEDGMPLDGE